MEKKSKKPRVFDLKGKKRNLRGKGCGPCPHCHDIYQGDSKLKEHMDKCRMKIGKKSKKPKVFDLKGKKRNLRGKGRGLCPHCHDIYQGDSELKEHMDKCRMKMGKNNKKPKVFDLKGKKRDLRGKRRGPCPHCHDIYQGDSELKEPMDKCRMNVIQAQLLV